MKARGVPWGHVGSHGVTWGPVGSHGVTWGPMGSPPSDRAKSSRARQKKDEPAPCRESNRPNPVSRAHGTGTA
eukprot:2983969-Prymnesium_polylepis.1